MATDIVQSLFGLDPYQTQMQQQDALRQQAAAYANMAPQQRAAMSLYQAGGQLAGAGAEGLFGMVNPAVAKAQATEQALMDLDTMNPQSILAKAAVTTDPRLRIQLQLLAQKVSEQQLDTQKKQSDIELAKAHAKYYSAGGRTVAGSMNDLSRWQTRLSDTIKQATIEGSKAALGLPAEQRPYAVQQFVTMARDAFIASNPQPDGTVPNTEAVTSTVSPTTAPTTSGMSFPKVTPLQDAAALQDRLAILRRELKENGGNPTDVALLNKSITDTEAQLAKYRGLPTSAETAGAIERAKQGEKVVETTTPSGTAAFARAGDSIGQAPAQYSPQVKGAVSQAEATGREVGQVAGKAQTELAGLDERQALAFAQVDELLRHPGFSSTVGATMLPGMRFIPGTKEASFMARFEQIKGGSFLRAYETLKGAGQITEIEGDKATAALNRMSISTKESEFRAAAKDFKDAVRVGFNKIRAQAALSKNSSPQPGVEEWARGPDGKLRRVR